MYQKIIVCIDETSASEIVTRVGADLACRYDAEIVLLSVFDPARFTERLYTGLGAAQMLEQHSRSLSKNAHHLGAMLHGMGVRSRQVVIPGRPADTILNLAETEAADLIVIGTESRGRLHAWLNNDPCSKVSHKAQCNVLRVTQSSRNKGRKKDSTLAPTEAGKSLLATSISAL